MGEIMIIDNVFLKHLWGSKEPPYSKEWNKRIKLWISELLNHLYTELGEMEFEGFTTMEQLSYEQAVNREFYPMPKGPKWGAKWEYGWFKTALCSLLSRKEIALSLCPRPGVTELYSSTERPQVQ